MANLTDRYPAFDAQGRETMVSVPPRVVCERCDEAQKNDEAMAEVVDREGRVLLIHASCLLDDDEVA